MITLPARSTVAVFAGTLNAILAGPVPLVGSPTTIHALVDRARQRHVEAAVKLPVKDPPAAETESDVGAIAQAQPCPGEGGGGGGGCRVSAPAS
jgi:hypothetical protein